MAKSLRSKKKKRLRTLRREIAKPFYDKKEESKLAVQEAAMSAPKLPPPPSAVPSSSSMDVDMIEGKPADNVGDLSLKPTGGVKKKMKKIARLKKDLRKKNKKKKNRF